MKYYDALLRMGVFSKREINTLTGNAESAKSLLRSAEKSGLVERIRHNYYAVKSLETGKAIPSRFAIGSGISASAYISHHTAFEYYGMANQVFGTVYVSSDSKFRDFEHDGVTYKYLASKENFGIVSGAANIRVTDMARTVLDNIKDFSKNGGLEELLRCLSMVTAVEEGRLLEYLAKYENQFLYQKAGYILSQCRNMKLSDVFFRTCKEHIGKSVRYLYDGIQYESPKYYAEWQLHAPADLMKLTDEGGDAIV
ncbi:MAG: type IV toxin-antitoxin system AbiEi family antitoxin domain-containing protein [Oscillospiraceae bacterium]